MELFRSQGRRNSEFSWNTDWTAIFADVTADEMTNQFTISIMDLMHRFIPNQSVKCDDRDPPWINPKLKTVIIIKIEIEECLHPWMKEDQAVRPLTSMSLNILVGLTLKLIPCVSQLALLKTSGRLGLFLEYFVLLAWKGLFW